MPNASIGGARWVRNELGGQNPIIVEMVVADNNTLAIFNGDFVSMTSGGVAYPTAAGGLNIIGVCNGVVQYWDGENMRKGNYLPATTRWSINSRQSIISVILARGALFEIDANDGTTATTEAAHQLFLGENADIVATAGTTANGRSGHVMNISDHKTTTAQLRLRALSRRVDQDYAADRVKYIVAVNEGHLSETDTAGV